MAEWSKAPDSSSGLRERAWVQIPLLTICEVRVVLKCCLFLGVLVRRLLFSHAVRALERRFVTVSWTSSMTFSRWCRDLSLIFSSSSRLRSPAPLFCHWLFKLTCLRFSKGASGKDVEAFRGLGSLIVLGGSVGGVTY
ncbi:hypothetical protein Bca4012_061116 [Brassica carinata]